MAHIAYRHFRGMLHTVYVRLYARELIGRNFSWLIIGISSLYITIIFGFSVFHLSLLPEDKTFFVVLAIMLLYNNRLLRSNSYLGI